MLKKNVGNLDRIVRLVLGVVLLGAFFAMPDASYRWFLLIGVVPLVTSLMGSCPLYTVFGLSTCPMKRQ